MIFRVSPELTLNIVNKGLNTPEIFKEEGSELRSYDKSSALVVVFMLSPSEVDGATEKSGGKKDTMHSCSTKNFEVILTLLTKVVVIYVRFLQVSLRVFSLEWALS